MRKSSPRRSHGAEPAREKQSHASERTFHAVSLTPRDGTAENPQLFNYLPRQVLLHWLEGRFANTQLRSRRYYQLGWFLLLRGIYLYCVTPSLNSKPIHAGFCEIELDDNEPNIFIRGLRIIGPGSVSQGSTEKQTKQSIIPDFRLWNSTLLKLEPHGDAGKAAHIDFVYESRELKQPEHFTNAQVINQLKRDIRQTPGLIEDPMALLATAKPLIKEIKEHFEEAWEQNRPNQTGADESDPVALVKLNSKWEYETPTPTFEGKYLALRHPEQYLGAAITFSRLEL